MVGGTTERRPLDVPHLEKDLKELQRPWTSLPEAPRTRAHIRAPLSGDYGRPADVHRDQGPRLVECPKCGAYKVTVTAVEDAAGNPSGGLPDCLDYCRADAG